MVRAGSWLTALASCGVLLGAPAARAEGGPRFDDKRIHVEARAGFGTPVGLYGLVLELNAFDWLAVGGGVGESIDGRQWEAHARVRPYVIPKRSGWLQAFTLEGAYSRGPYAHRNLVMTPCIDVCESTEWDPRTLSWAQAEAGLETRSPAGFTWRVGGGLAVPVSSQATTCTTEDHIAMTVVAGPCDAEPSPFLVVLSGAVGFAF